MSDLPNVEDLLLEPRQSALFVTLNRPKAKNALSAGMVESLTKLCAYLSGTDRFRAVVLRGADGAFCAGGDIKDFSKQLMAPEPAPGEPDIVVASNRVFGDLLLALDAIPQVLIVAVEGPAFGGAMGLISVSDVAVAEAQAKFALSEASLGIPPAQIAPFVMRRIGLFQARRLTLTASRFGVDEAERIGLVHQVVTGSTGVDAAINQILNAVGRCEPGAIAASKAIYNRVSPLDPALLDQAAEDFAHCLRGAGKLGAVAFAQKQTPPWVEDYAQTSIDV
ncbi:MAG: enoyl-CoA hydratase-related protein [Pseudomonadota bacterium]